MEKAILKVSLCRIAALCTFLTGLLLGTVSPAAAAKTSFFGSAALNYVSYDAEADGRSLFSGDTFAQQYSVAWSTTNLFYRDQPRYYSLMAGYDWTTYDTTTSSPGGEQNFKDNYGKFLYDLAVGYTPPQLPIRFNAFMSDKTFSRFRENIFTADSLIPDGLIYDLEGRGTTSLKGFTIDFYPDQASQLNLRGLPRIRIEYREALMKNEDRFSSTDRLTKEAMVSLGKGGNWFNYRSKEIVNNLDSRDKSDQQQLQIGHVDPVGRRQWTALTNWINVSADGQLSNIKSAGSQQSEEYDVNFQAIATRRHWQARTFMNFNRYLEHQELTEELRLPLSIKGSWGVDTTWYASVSTLRGRQIDTFPGQVDKSYNNTLTAGATLFSRARFTLSPFIMLKTYKHYGGEDAYEGSIGLETASTGRFSNKLFINAKNSLRVLDDGYGTDTSKTWSNQFTFNGKYLQSRSVTYDLRQTFEIGNGSAYLDPRWQMYNPGSASELQNYIRSLTSASIGYSSLKGFSAGLAASYDLIMNSGLPDKTQTMLSSHASYSKNSLEFLLRTTYDRRDDGMGGNETDIYGYLQLAYRPNRYHEGSLRYTLTQDGYAGGNEKTRHELLQQQTYRYFSRTGTGRELALLTQEFSYKNDDDIVSKYLSLTGRYALSTRLSLSGSVKYYTDPYAVTMYYSAGVGANFKLFNTSVEYSLAQRDKDDRIEKKLAASVSRSF